MRAVDADLEEIFDGFGAVAVVGGGVELSAGLVTEGGGGEFVGAGGDGASDDAGEEDVGSAVDADFDPAVGFVFEGSAEFVGGGGFDDEMMQVGDDADVVAVLEVSVAFGLHVGGDEDAVDRRMELQLADLFVEIGDLLIEAVDLVIEELGFAEVFVLGGDVAFDEPAFADREHSGALGFQLRAFLADEQGTLVDAGHGEDLSQRAGWRLERVPVTAGLISLVTKPSLPAKRSCISAGSMTPWARTRSGHGITPTAVATMAAKSNVVATALKRTRASSGLVTR